jgi:hypothetical protein
MPSIEAVGGRYRAPGADNKRPFRKIEPVAAQLKSPTSATKSAIHVNGPDANTAFKANDILLLEAEPAVLQRVVGEAKLKLARDDKEQEIDTPSDEIGIMEAVITDESELVDRTPAQFRLYQRYQVNLLAISRRGERITRQMRSLKLNAGDVLVLRGNLNTLPETLGELHCLPLAGRDLQLGAGRHSFLPLVVLLAAMALASVHVLPVAIVFFGAAVVMLLIRALSLREAYDTNGPFSCCLRR